MYNAPVQSLQVLTGKVVMAQRTAAKKSTVKTNGAGKTTPAKKKDTPSPVYFLSLELENVRCFGPRQRLDLSDGNGRPARWTVILGENGVGKTTLLQSLACIDRDFSGSFLENQLSFRWFPQRHKGDNEPALFEVNFFYGERLQEKIKSAECAFSYTLGRHMAQSRLLRCDDFSFLGNEAISATLSYTYGASRRMSRNSSLTTSGKSTDKYDISNFSSLWGNVDLPNAEEWLLQADYAASKPSSVQRQAVHRRDEIRKILIEILPDVEDIEFTVPDEKNPQPGVLFKTHYGWVSIWDLSHGYQTLIAWVVDFARRMFERYPESKNPLAEPAVVLVDEIDLHLHPTWQRSLMSYLTERFPNTQFIVTAHSPLIVQGAKDVNVVLLRRKGDHVVIENRDSESIRNWRVDQILTSDLFGLESLRPPYVEEKLAERRKLLSKGKLTKKDRERIEKLEAEIGPLPTGDTPQEIKAMDIINRAAKLLSERSGVK